MSAPAVARLLEGSLRDVTVADVLQLLDLGRRTGVLHLDDPLGARRARVTLVDGRICAADLEPRPAGRWAEDAREVVIELLSWSTGRFAVEPLPVGICDRIGAIGVDSVLMEAARRADEWARLADRVPGPDAVPRLAEPGDSAGALALAPEEWAVLAYADGASDLRVLASRAGRDLLAVARAVHRLVGEGFLVVRADTVPPDGRRSSLG